MECLLRKARERKIEKSNFKLVPEEKNVKEALKIPVLSPAQVAI